MIKPAHIAVLGGGPAGLAVGYYAQKHRLPFTIYESRSLIGGNCITLKRGEFLFDSGAHRLHDKDEAVTREIKELLGEKLKKISAPSQIYRNGKLIDFPLSPLNLLKNLGIYTSIKAGFEIAALKLANKKSHCNSFENFALLTYGETIANYFLLNYSEKLWGVSCNKLSPNISGNRLKGLSLKTFVKEIVFGNRVKVEHLDGSFYYPEVGIGTIPNKIADFCGENNIQKNSKITKIVHNYTRIQTLEINHERKVDVDEVVSTLPLSVLLQIMEPLPAEDLLLAAKSLRYRNLVLVAIFLNRKSVTKNASVYFPDSNFPFTRVYEPKNRSKLMAPWDKTSLVAEIPCQSKDKLWNIEDEKLIRLTCSKFVQIDWIAEKDVIGASVVRINQAYPILETGFEDKNQQIFDFLHRFQNLRISGRNGKFAYTHIHDMMRFGKEIVEEYTSSSQTKLG